MYPKHFILLCKAALPLDTPQFPLCCIFPHSSPPSTAYFILLIDGLVPPLTTEGNSPGNFAACSPQYLQHVTGSGTQKAFGIQLVNLCEASQGPQSYWSSKVTFAVLTTSKIHRVF